MVLIAHAFKGQVHVFAGRVKIVSHLSCRTSAINILSIAGNKNATRPLVISSES